MQDLQYKATVIPVCDEEAGTPEPKHNEQKHESTTKLICDEMAEILKCIDNMESLLIQDTKEEDVITTVNSVSFGTSTKVGGGVIQKYMTL